MIVPTAPSNKSLLSETATGERRLCLRFHGCAVVLGRTTGGNKRCDRVNCYPRRQAPGQRLPSVAQSAAADSSNPQHHPLRQVRILRTRQDRPALPHSPALRGTSYAGLASCKSINPERVESKSGTPHHRAMPQSLAKILIHAVFSTKERRPFLRDKALREELHRYLGGSLTNLKCQPIIAGGVEDHLHLLCALSRTCE